MNGLANIIGTGFIKITNYLHDMGELTTDIPFVKFSDFENMTEMNIGLIIGFKTAKKIPGKKDIQSILLPPGKMVSCLHKGSYDELAALYKEMSEWV